MCDRVMINLNGRWPVITVVFQEMEASSQESLEIALDEMRSKMEWYRDAYTASCLKIVSLERERDLAVGKSRRLQDEVDDKDAEIAELGEQVTELTERTKELDGKLIEAELELQAMQEEHEDETRNRQERKLKFVSLVVVKFGLMNWVAC